MSPTIQVESGLNEPGPDGGNWEHLDESRREIVHLCGKKGITLFTFLLQSATIKHAPGQGEVAVFALRRLRDLVAAIGCGYDTLTRYVAIFRALGLVRHYRDRRAEVELQIPLGPYIYLTNFAALDDLIRETRKKQQQLATNIKTRYILRFGDPTQAHAEQTLTALHEIKTILDEERLEPLKRQRLQIKIADLITRCTGKGPFRAEGDLDQLPEDQLQHQCPTTTQEQSSEIPSKGDLKTLEGDLSPISSPSFTREIRAEGDSNQQQGDLTIISHLSHSDQMAHKGDSNWKQGDPTTIPHLSHSDQMIYKGDSDQEQGDPLRQDVTQQSQIDSLQGDLNEARGDPATALHTPHSYQSEQKGDSDLLQGDLTAIISAPTMNTTGTQGDPKADQGDLMLHQSAQEIAAQPQKGDLTDKIVLEQGDPKPSKPTEVQPDDLLTYNVNYLINNITVDNVTRKRAAQFLGKILENDTNAFTKYLKLFKDYKPEIIGRAFLCTMVLIHRDHWAVDRPGALFTNQCRILAGQTPLKSYTLDEVETWLHTWGQLAYPELVVALTIPFSAMQPSEPAALITGPQQTPAPRTPGYFSSSTKKKRTYGMQYTSSPRTLNRGANNLGSVK